MDLNKVYSPISDNEYPNRSELDSHADTCVAGANTVPIYFTDQNVSVSPFIGEYAPLENVPIATVATAWDDLSCGRTILLIINEALYFGDRMGHSLLCPNQLRCNGVTVNDVPPVFGSNSSHSIILPEGIEIPLKMRGVMSFIDTRKPTEYELTHCEKYELTSPSPWEPHTLNLTTGFGVEDDPTWIIGDIKSQCRSDPPELSISAFDRLLPCEESSSDGARSRVIHEADVISIDVEHREAMATSSGSRASTITKEDLAKRWFIGLDIAARTLDATTKMGMRYVEGPLERRLRTSQAHMRFPNLEIRTYTDTMFSSKKSIRGYSCAQVLTDGHHFCRVYPLRSKGDAHHALMSFIHEVGIPKTLHSDLALEETRGEWSKIIKQYHINQTTTEAKSPWQKQRLRSEN